ncbi:MAG: YodL domain-containing protein [Candidatus Ornithomonoglobus sp.]
MPIYKESARYAYKNGERDQWRRSNRINNECAEYIRSHADEAHNNHDLRRFIRELTDKFGLERSMHVIARNIQARGGDRRFNDEVRERADQFQFSDMKLDYDNTNSYLVNTHSVVLNFIFRDMMDIEKELNHMPDKTTSEQMHEYGYTSDIMLPMDAKAAKEYFDKGLPIYALHEDNTESMITGREEIDEHGGLFGIEADEWKAYLDGEHHAPDIEKQPENKEASFIFGQDSAFAIYQLRDDAPRELKFEGIKSIGGVDNVIKENYQMVYSDGIELDGTENTYDILDGIYTEFNQFHPEDFKGHSLSVSDIVVLRQDGELSPYFVDRFGFEEIRHFYGDNPKDLVWDNDKQTYLAKATERMEGRNNEQMLPETNPIADNPAGRMEDMVISGNATLYSAQLERAKQTAQSKRTKPPAQRTSLRKRINDNKAKISGKAAQDKPKTKHKGLEV